MSIKYIQFDSLNQPVEDTLAGNYTAAAPSGGDSELSTLSSNWVENRVIAAKILQDEADYLSKVDGEARYAIEYRSTVPTTIKDKIYVINGDAFLGDSTNGTLTQLSKVVTVNGQSPDVNGNVAIGVGVTSVNGQTPVSGDVTVSASGIPTSVSGETVQDVIDGRVKTVNSVSPDSNGNVTIDVGVKTVNSNSPAANGNINIDVGVKTVNGTLPDANGNVNIVSGNVTASLSGNVLTLVF